MSHKHPLLQKLELAAKNKRTPILGAAVGCGLFAKYAEAGGVDLILVLNAGRYRVMGLSSLASLLPYANSNEMVMDIGTREVLTGLSAGTPCLFGLCATDPAIDLPVYLQDIQEAGFTGIVNFPTVGIIDGQYGEALEEAGISYAKEVEAIAAASRMGLFTVAFVFQEEQAELMAQAGADVICAHLGFTAGGLTGVRHVLTMEESAALAQRIYNAARNVNPDIIRLLYGGPIQSPEQAEEMYRLTDAMGYIGGSSFERIPTETSIVRITEMFKQYEAIKHENERLRQQLSLHTAIKNAAYVDYVTEYVASRLAEPVSFAQLARELHINRNYLSQLFRAKTGTSFSEWLIDMRLSKAKELLAGSSLSIQEIARAVGYDDSSYFSRLFKKHTGTTPRAWR